MWNEAAVAATNNSLTPGSSGWWAFVRSYMMNKKA